MSARKSAGGGPQARTSAHGDRSFEAAVQRRADSVGAAMEEVGDRWTFLVLREVFYGVNRFSEIARNLGIARNLLSQRLTSLVDKGVLERHQYSERPARSEYRLTPKGLDLYNVVIALIQWADRWIVGHAALRLTHAADGGQVEQVLRCRSCGTELTALDVAYQEAPDSTNG
jgi:DNA-binding HxlR family transcriptional regulator